MMPNNQDPLSQLWQQQEVQKPDLNVINKAWRIMQVKQKLYACLDILGLFIPILMLYLNREKLDSFTAGYFVVLTFLLLPFVAYILWLRRFSMGWSSENTERHIHNLKRQIANNIKIAALGKLSIWPIGVLIVLHYVGLFYFDVLPVDRLIRKGLISVCVFAVLFPAIWIWATRRENRFKKELSDLNNLLGIDKEP
ncbi:MAG: hypothetical protein ABJH28_07660 [Paraglaciecola sp.]|uniref:hypothetical protein n=2 Tax=Paraglaciecola sp. TaxID=1920173 RepID=UPI003266FEC4